MNVFLLSRIVQSAGVINDTESHTTRKCETMPRGFEGGLTVAERSEPAHRTYFVFKLALMRFISASLNCLVHFDGTFRTVTDSDVS